MLRRLSLFGLVFAFLACTPGTSSSLRIAGRDVESLIAASDVVIVGRVMGEAGTRNLVRDPYDIQKEHKTLVGVAQDYAVEIERTIKGANLPAQVIVTNSRSMGPRGGQQVQNERFIPLNAGSRYVLFAQRLVQDPTVFVLSFEPSVFELGQTASVHSVWPEARWRFPPKPAELFVAEVVAAAARTRTP
jgi:hypothetical protein